MRYVHSFKDRHGEQRHYFRRRGCARIALPGLPGSREFMEAYQAALDGKPPAPKSRAAPGTLSALIEDWYRSTGYRGLRQSTRKAYRNIVERLRVEHGTKTVVNMQAKHVRAIMAAKAETPHQANRALKLIRLLMEFAVLEGYRDDNPAYGVKPMRARSVGFHTWTEEEIAQFEAFWPLGTRPRLAFTLLLETAQRRGDMLRMGRQHVRNGRIEITQGKTGETLILPISSELQQAIDAGPCGDLTFVVTQSGKPFTSAGFGNYFREVCRQAGLPDRCASHGLRKAMSRRLAEVGNSNKRIASITGHRTSAQLDVYTRAADQARMAQDAVRSLRTKNET